jgi:high-affinity K+ transport system ATPase subunit B
MITGDNKLTAAAIGAEAGVDDVLAEATPEAKPALIRRYQADGYMVAMTGDGTNVVGEPRVNVLAINLALDRELANAPDADGEAKAKPPSS